MSKGQKRRRRRKSSKRKPSPAYKLLVAILVLLLSVSGYSYRQTGSITGLIRQMAVIASAIDDFEDGVDLVQDAFSGQVDRWLRRHIETDESGQLTEIPSYEGQSYVIVNDNVPDFSDEARSTGTYEFYSELDGLGRCGYAEAKLCPELMPTEERGKIGMVKPTGWHTVKYEEVEGNYLYNRCHLIGYQLAGENANEKNLITGTRYLNVEGMLPFENKVAEYIRDTGDAVLYRVTPIFEGDNLVASGVHMEAESLGTEEIRFNIYVFNIQPGIEIDYKTGESKRRDTAGIQESAVSLFVYLSM